MISKELFVKVINFIQEQQELESQFSDALSKLGDGYIVFDSKYLKALLEVLHEVVPDKYDYIGWYLWEAPDTDRTIYDESNDKKWVIDTPQKLYQYLLTTQDD